MADEPSSSKIMINENERLIFYDLRRTSAKLLCFIFVPYDPVYVRIMNRWLTIDRLRA